jgi:anti-repressor protein
MDELITTQTDDNGNITVSGRLLHEFLEVSTRYNDWIMRMLEYGFNEDIDFQAITQKRVTAQGNETTYTDHQLKIDMAKEICMLQRTDRGKEARQYFIGLERKWNDPMMVVKRGMDYLQTQVDALQNVNVELTERIADDRPKVLFAESVETSKDTILIGQLAKLMKQNGVDIGQNRLFAWLREHDYLCKHGEMYNQPTQHALDLKLFEVKTRTVNNPDGSVRITRTTKVTGKGQIYLLNKFLNSQDVQMVMSI